MFKIGEMKCFTAWSTLWNRQLQSGTDIPVEFSVAGLLQVTSPLAEINSAPQSNRAGNKASENFMFASEKQINLATARQKIEVSAHAASAFDKEALKENFMYYVRNLKIPYY